MQFAAWAAATRPVTRASSRRTWPAAPAIARRPDRSCTCARARSSRPARRPKRPAASSIPAPACLMTCPPADENARPMPPCRGRRALAGIGTATLSSYPLHERCSPLPGLQPRRAFAGRGELREHPGMNGDERLLGPSHSDPPEHRSVSPGQTALRAPTATRGRTAPRAWPAAACRHSPRRAGMRSGRASGRRSPCHGAPTRRPPRCTETTGWGWTGRRTRSPPLRRAADRSGPGGCRRRWCRGSARSRPASAR
jgi:hypothetical protein